VHLWLAMWDVTEVRFTTAAVNWSPRRARTGHAGTVIAREVPGAATAAATVVVMPARHPPAALVARQVRVCERDVDIAAPQYVLQRIPSGFRAPCSGTFASDMDWIWKSIGADALAALAIRSESAMLSSNRALG